MENIKNRVNKTYKKEIIIRGDEAYYLNYKRFSSGIFSLDLAIGGGIPFGRISLLHGSEHSGKTLIGIVMAKSIRNYCKHCLELLSKCKCEKTEPCEVLYIDVEYKLDKIWASALGLLPEEYYLARPEYAEQVIDIVTETLQEDGFNLVILDSIASLIPAVEMEKSAEDATMGVVARLMNRGLREWTRLMRDNTNKHLLLINQNREKIGVVFGDNTALPGGKGQLFHCALRIATKSPHIKSEGGYTGSVELGGKIHKNGTFIPKLEFNYEVGLRDTNRLNYGEIDNYQQLLNYGKMFGIIKKDKGWKIEGTEIEGLQKQEELLQVLKENTELQDKVWQMLLEKGCMSMYKGDFKKKSNDWAEKGEL